MSSEIGILHVTAATIAIVHTFVGVDHYLPFAVLSRAQNWTISKLIGITAVCGLAHVLGSVILGLIGISFGWAIGGIEDFESIRGSLASWLLIGFGSLYMIWGIFHFLKKTPHTHNHLHQNTSTESNKQNHKSKEDLNLKTPKTITFWSIFILFILGPCEALIPLLMFPAMEHSWAAVFSITFIFGFTTITTMTVLSLLAHYGFKLPFFKKIEHLSHPLAGFSIIASGLGIKLLGF